MVAPFRSQLAEQIQAEFARDLMNRGANSSPIQHPMQGAERMTNSILGGLLQMQAMQKSEAQNKAIAEALQPGMYQGGLDPATAGGVGAVPQEPNFGRLAQTLLTMGQTGPALGLMQNQYETQRRSSERAEDRSWRTQDREDEQKFRRDLASEERSNRAAPSSVQEFEYARRNGYTGTFAEYKRLGSTAPSSVQEWEYYNALPPDQKEQYLSMKRANPYLNLGGTMAQPSMTEPGKVKGEIGKTLPPQDQPEVKGQQAYETAIGKGRGERVMDAPAALAKVGQQVAPLDRMAETVSRLTAMPGLDEVTGWRSTLPIIPGTDRANAQAQMETLKSQIAQNVLQMYRSMSQTGGAVGQVAIAEQEMFMRNLGSLEQAQTPEQFRLELQRIMDFAQGSKQRLLNAHQSQFPASPLATDQPVTPPVYETNPSNNPSTPRPASKQEFDALPSGTYFVDPQGNGRIKP
jgi:hypothetical protein